MGRGGCLGRAGLGNAKMSDCPFTVWQKSFALPVFTAFVFCIARGPSVFARAAAKKKNCMRPQTGARGGHKKAPRAALRPLCRLPAL